MGRFRFLIDFPFPSQEIRKQLWQKVFPPQSPIENLDYQSLSKMSLSGGNIETIALNASFLAAQNGGKITMNEIMIASKIELTKLGKTL